MSLTLEAIKELRKSEELGVLNSLAEELKVDALVVPTGYDIHHLEQYREYRERLKGKMETSDIKSFQAYAVKFMPDGNQTLVFVDPASMAARCALNFGSTEKPGHADHWAVLKLEKTAEYKAMLKVAESHARSPQKAAAEWCEDHVQFITFHNDDPDGISIDRARAIKAIRNLKIEAKAESGSGVGNYSREKSLMESTKVDTSEGLPHFIRFACVPYQGLQEREFLIRLGVGQDGSGNATFVFQIVRHDIEVQAMAEELADLLRMEMDGLVQVYLGNFSK